MRIIAGRYKGQTLEAPMGPVTRPTTDRMRESLMSRIASLRGGFDDAVVLDAFAGSGALGLEALSRGARFCCFCERDRTALRTLRSNIGRLGLEADAYELCSQDVFRAALRLSQRGFDLILLDPPYRYGLSKIAALLEALSQRELLVRGAVVSYEHSRGNEADVERLLAGLGFCDISSRESASSSIALALYQP